MQLLRRLQYVDARGAERTEAALLNLEARNSFCDQRSSLQELFCSAIGEFVLKGGVKRIKYA